MLIDPKKFETPRYEDRYTFTQFLFASPMGLAIAAILVAGSLAPAQPLSSRDGSVVAAVPRDFVTDTQAAAPRTVPADRLRELLSNPEVRSFKGPAEYAWDFTDPDAMAGFGPLDRAGGESKR